MKSLHLIIAAPFLFILGLLAGRGFFPAGAPASQENAPARSERSSRENRPRYFTPAPTNTATAANPAGLLDLVDANDPFTTSTRLRASLQDLGPAALESLLQELHQEPNNHPGFYTVRLSLLNHLVSKDPFQALDLILAHENREFQTSGISVVMKAITRLGTDAKEEALALIDDPQLKLYAQNTTIAPNPDSTPEELLALLKSGSSQAHFPLYNFPSHGAWGSGLWGCYGSPVYPAFSNSSNGALAQLAQKDLASAESYALGLETENEKHQALLQIAQGLAAEDPGYALEWVSRQDSPAVRDQSMASILATLGNTDPARAASLIGEIENINQRTNSISNIAAQWAFKDPQAAIAWVESLPPSNARLGAYTRITQQLATSNPRAAIDLAGSLPGQARQQAIPNIISQWSASDFEGARDWVTAQSDPALLETVLSNFISPWAQKNPAEAAAFLEQAATRSPASQNFTNQLSALGRQWAGSDRDAAMTWARSLENESQRSSAMSGIHNQWTADDPNGAAQHLTTLTDPDQRSQLLHGIARNLGSQDPQAAEAWLATLPADERFTAANSTISSFYGQDPQLAAGLYDRMVIEANNDPSKLDTINRHADDIARQWVNHAPQEAAEWATGIPTEQARADAFKNIVSGWAQFDPDGTAGWIDSLPDGKPRDEATYEFVQNLRQHEPATAAAWANTISNDDARYRSFRDAVNQWHRFEPEAAREAISNANLSSEQQNRLFRQIR